ncbi:HAD-hyrolase-like [Bradyrhizobium erythrophlei]|uniref:HAD-hyrolase-like n=1 Tax=Bradyrhizobium erythrophlei TaxID=1437360 RepID=A0A1H4Y593_9BRAD|nr:HAD-hyrolase-like [Bradyrhizobium erythrophlei]
MHNAQSKRVGQLRLSDRKVKLLVSDHIHRSKPLAQFRNQIGHAPRCGSCAQIDYPLPEQCGVNKRLAPERSCQSRTRTKGSFKRIVINKTKLRFRYAKPDPDLFLAAAARLNAPIETAIVVGDSVWDMMAAVRCRALGVGLLSGGYGPDELRQSGAFRVYDDPADLLRRIDEVGGRR